MVIAAFKNQHDFKDSRTFNYTFELSGTYNNETAELDGSALKLWKLIMLQKNVTWDAAVDYIGETNLRKAITQLLKMGYASGMRDGRIIVYAKPLYYLNDLW